MSRCSGFLSILLLHLLIPGSKEANYASAEGILSQTGKKTSEEESASPHIIDPDAVVHRPEKLAKRSGIHTAYHFCRSLVYPAVTSHANLIGISDIANGSLLVSYPMISRKESRFPTTLISHLLFLQQTSDSRIRCPRSRVRWWSSWRIQRSFSLR